MQPERNHQERGDVSRASLSIAGRLVKQRAVGLNCVNYGMLCVYLVFMCGVYISAVLVVVLKRCGERGATAVSKRRCAVRKHRGFCVCN